MPYVFDDGKPDKSSTYTFEPMKVAEPPRVAPTFMENYGSGLYKALWAGPKQLALMAGEQLGLADPGSAAQYTQEVQNDLNMLEYGRGPDAGINWAQLAGEATPWLVAGAGLAPKAATAATVNPLTEGTFIGASLRAAPKAAAIGAASTIPTFAQPGVGKGEQALLGGAGGALLGGPGAVGLTRTVGWAAKKAHPAYMGILKWAAPDVEGQVLQQAQRGATAMGESIIDEGSPSLAQAASTVAAHADDPVTQEATGVIDGLLGKFGLSWANISEKSRKKAQELATRQVEDGVIDPDALARKILLDELGITERTLGQITQDPGQWAAEYNFSGINVDPTNPMKSNPVMDVYRKQAGQLKEAIRRGLTAFGGDPDLAGAPEATGKKLFDALDSRWDLMQKAIGKMYKKAAEEAGGAEVILGEADAVARGWGDYSKNYGSLANFLKRIDNIGADEPFTVAQAEVLRQEVGKAAANASNAQERWLLRQLVDAIDADVEYSTGSQVFAKARGAAAQRFAEGKVGSRGENALLAKVFGEEVSPYQFMQSTIYSNSVSPEAVKNLVITLKKPSPLLKGKAAKQALEEGAAALGEIKSRIYEHLFRMGEDSPTITGKMVRDRLNKIGKEKMQAIFSKEELAEIYKRANAATILDQTGPAFARANRSNTGVMGMNEANRIAAMTQKTLGDLPVVGPVIKGALSIPGVSGVAEHYAQKAVTDRANAFANQAVQGGRTGIDYQSAAAMGANKLANALGQYYNPMFVTTGSALAGARRQ